MKVKKGTTRIVFLIGRIAIKVPNFTYCWLHFVKGIAGNIQESHTWKYNSGSYETGKSYMLCPVLWCSWGGWVLIMRRVQSGINECHSTAEHEIHFPGDDTLANYGVLNGVVVKIDYAG